MILLTGYLSYSIIIEIIVSDLEYTEHSLTTGGLIISVKFDDHPTPVYCEKLKHCPQNGLIRIPCSLQDVKICFPNLEQIKHVVKLLTIRGINCLKNGHGQFCDTLIH